MEEGFIDLPPEPDIATTEDVVAEALLEVFFFSVVASLIDSSELGPKLLHQDIELTSR